MSTYRWAAVRRIAEGALSRARDPFPSTEVERRDREVKMAAAELALALVMLDILDGAATPPVFKRKPRTRRTK